MAYIYYAFTPLLREHWDQWREQFPLLCVVDRKPEKHGEYKGVQICSLQEALSRYPDADILVTAKPRYFYEIQDLLLSHGVDKTRITNPYYAGNSPKHCQHLLRFLVVYRLYGGELGFGTCCMAQTWYGAVKESTDSMLDIIRNYKTHYGRLYSDLKQGWPSPCDGCPELREGALDEEEPEINTVNLSTGIPGGDICNFRCCYCGCSSVLNSKSRANGAQKREDENDTLLQYVRDLESIYAGKKMNFNYAAGELCVSPYCDAILRIWKRNRWGGVVFSNCSKYNELLSELLSENSVMLYCSLDAGTSETFAKIKRVNCFDTVKENLRKYAVAARSGIGFIELKYILLDGINCTEQDVTGFVSFAKEIEAAVSIALDYAAANRSMTACEREAVTMMIAQLKQQKVRYGVQYSMFFPSDVPYLKLISEG